MQPAGLKLPIEWLVAAIRHRFYGSGKLGQAVGLHPRGALVLLVRGTTVKRRRRVTFVHLRTSLLLPPYECPKRGRPGRQPRQEDDLVDWR